MWASEETYSGGFAIYHGFLYVIDAFLGCNFGPLEESTLSSQVKQLALSLCYDRLVRELSLKICVERGYSGIQLHREKGETLMTPNEVYKRRTTYPRGH